MKVSSNPSFNSCWKTTYVRITQVCSSTHLCGAFQHFQLIILVFQALPWLFFFIHAVLAAAVFAIQQVMNHATLPAQHQTADRQM